MTTSMSKSFKFQWKEYSGFIEGVNGSIIFQSKNDDNAKIERPMAESCMIEVVENDTLRTWQKCVRKKDLDGASMKEVSDIVAAIENSQAASPTVSFSLSEKPQDGDGSDLSMVFTFPVFLRNVSVEFILESIHEDEMTILQKQVHILTIKLDESKQNEKKLFAQIKSTKVTEKKLFDEIEKLKKSESTLLAKIEETNHAVISALFEKKVEEEKLVEKIRTFALCGNNLQISFCRTMLSHNNNYGWSSSTMGETMSDGVYYAEFMSVRMNTEYNFMCGIVPANERNLSFSIDCIEGGVRVFAHDGKAYKNDGSTTISTGLKGCSGTNGPIIVGVLLDLNYHKILFFINGVRCEAPIEIPAGEYCFAVSLYDHWDAVKLLTIEKRTDFQLY